MADPRLKALKIKTGVVKRLTKEKVMYEQEVEKQKERIQKLKEGGNYVAILFNLRFRLKYDLCCQFINIGRPYSIHLIVSSLAPV